MNKNNYEEYLKELEEIKQSAEFMIIRLKDEKIVYKNLKENDLENLKKINNKLDIIAFGNFIECRVPSDLQLPKD